MSALDELGHLGGKPLIVGGNAAAEKFFDGQLRALALEAYAKTHPTQELCALQTCESPVDKTGLRVKFSGSFAALGITRCIRGFRLNLKN